MFKYDGFQYVQYKNPNQNGRSISGLQLDSKNRVWCRNFNGQVYRVNGDFLQVISDFKQNTANNNFTIDEKCNAWIVCENRLVLFNENGHKLISYAVPNSVELNSNIIDVVFYKNELYLSQSQKGIMKFNRSSKAFKYLEIPEEKKLLIRRSTFFRKGNKLCVLSEELGGKQYYGSF